MYILCILKNLYILSTFSKSKHEKKYKIGREVPFYKNMS